MFNWLTFTYLSDEGSDIAVFKVFRQHKLLEITYFFYYKGVSFIVPTNYVVKLLILRNLSYTSSISNVFYKNAGIWLLKALKEVAFVLRSFFVKLAIINIYNYDNGWIRYIIK